MRAGALQQADSISGEPIDTFIQDLYKLSESCDYGNLREDLIRDRIVVGVFSDALSDSLQAKSDLSLKKAIELSRQAEARIHNREYVRENTAATNTSVDYVKSEHAINKHKAGAKPKGKNYPTADSSTTSTTRTDSCQWCGGSRYDRQRLSVEIVSRWDIFTLCVGVKSAKPC